MKKAFMIILAISAVSLLLFSLHSFFNRGFNNKEIVIETKILKVKVDYPNLKDPKINNDIKVFINQNISSARKLTPPSVSDPRNYKNELLITYDRPFVSKKYISLVFYVLTYSGGAHPLTAVVCKNYNAQNGKPLKLTDVCSMDKDRLRKLIIAKLLKKIDHPIEKWISEGVNENDLENFSLGQDSITFHFGQYEVAPYAQGIQKATFKLNELK